MRRPRNGGLVGLPVCYVTPDDEVRAATVVGVEQHGDAPATATLAVFDRVEGALALREVRGVHHDPECAPGTWHHAAR